jgi:hypothetical protein
MPDSALWLAKQMNLVEFVEAACGFCESPDHLQASLKIRSRFSLRIPTVAERTGGGFQAQNTRLYLQSGV